MNKYVQRLIPPEEEEGGTSETRDKEEIRGRKEKTANLLTRKGKRRKWG